MSTRILVSALVLTAFVAGLRADRVFPAASEAARYVDVNRCLREMPEFEQGMDAVQAGFRAEVERLQGIADDLRARKAALAELDPKSPEYQLAELRLKGEEEAAAREAEYLRRRQGAEMDALLDRTVRRIHVAAGKVGERNGYSAVLMKPSAFIDLTKGTINDSLDELETRWVMWSHPDHDVTDQVLAILAAGE